MLQIFAESMIGGKSITGNQNKKRQTNTLICEVIIYFRNRFKKRAKQVSERKTRIKNVRRVKK